MAASLPPTPLQRSALHDALNAFLGTWHATGQSYGERRQTWMAPRAAPSAWTSTHTAYWHSGGFFLVQNERAQVDGSPFDTLSLIGVDARTGHGFVHSFENHGFERRYHLMHEGRVWTLSGDTERARVVFSADGRTQNIHWEWRPEDGWLPLCDRVAVRVD
ncbi:DUF1579 family protein [Azohydromonas caseinilytica]|uniref:DUF1579 domain-containing protein n=1 Tax=Azohydromonas caseinilytica TaxID=2728836 RepID=A0A848FA14_9BURK|nr:DUF1579 family protein [Azohydromonas caseinilytica]NML16098.1 DUF1579 domain-containing protein [Azohydromonas caseinilytica]